MTGLDTDDVDAGSVGDGDVGRVGARLRDLRRACGMSLKEASAASAGRFGMSVIGAYERDERAIGVFRLEQLAHLYGATASTVLREPYQSQWQTRQQLVLKVATFRAGALGEAARRWVDDVLRSRMTPNAKRVAIPDDDCTALAAMIGVDRERLRQLLVERDALG